MGARAWTTSTKGVALRRVDGCGHAPRGCVEVRIASGADLVTAHLTPYEWATFVAAVTDDDRTPRFLEALTFHLDVP